MPNIIAGDLVMVSALTPEQQFIAQMDAEISFIERGHSVHDKELDEIMLKELMHFDAMAKEAKQSCLATQNSIEEVVGTLLTRLEKTDITHTSTMQVKNLQTRIGTLKKNRGELTELFAKAIHLHADQRKRQAELQQSLQGLQRKLTAARPKIVFPSPSDGFVFREGTTDV